MNIQKELMDWAEETAEVYNRQSTGIGYYTQTPLNIINKKPDMLILGINPGYGGGKENMTGEELLKGNPCFEGKDTIKVMSEEKDVNKNIKGWALWHRLNKMLELSCNQKYENILKEHDRFVLSNMIFYGTRKESQIPKINREECAKQTIKLISKLHPKVVLLLGSQSRKLFNSVSENKLKVLVPNSMYYCMSEKSHVLAIKHTAYYYSSIEMELIGKTIVYLLDHHDETITSESIRVSSLKDEIMLFEEKKKSIQINNPAIKSGHIIELITTNVSFLLNKIEGTSERYSLSENLILTITKTGNGYLAIRHKNYDGKIHYPNSKYEHTNKYRNILNRMGWNCDSDVWIGTKLFRDYGKNEDEIVTNIVFEINEIVELVRNN